MVAVKTVNNNTTSTPVIRTGVYSHMPIVVTGQFVTTGSTRCMLPKLCTFWPRGLTRGPKFIKKGDELLPTQAVLF